MRGIKFVDNSFYHIFNRGANKSQIFLDSKDYLRFVHNLYEFNDTKPAIDFRVAKTLKENHVQRKEREQLVDILCWCIMPNHFHLVVSQKIENGITNFMQKLGTGYALFLNEKYERSGHVFQGPFKAILIEDNNYLLHISRYIHLNPLEIIESQWKKVGIQDWDNANKFLLNYRWSSYQDWLSTLSSEARLPEITVPKNFPSIINISLKELPFENVSDYQNFLKEWTNKEQDRIKEYILE